MAIPSGSKRVIVMALIAIGASTCLGAEPAIIPLPGSSLQPAALSMYRVAPLDPGHKGVDDPHAPQFYYATDSLWQYLRRGLNYLESPKPLEEPEAVAPSYVHPDGRGFGCYGFSPEAYQDVQRLYPYFRRISWERILNSPRLYDLANQAFCDWLIKNLQNHVALNSDPARVFDVVQKAWNLGLSGFKKGRIVVSSRMRRAEEFKGYY